MTIKEMQKWLEQYDIEVNKLFEENKKLYRKNKLLEERINKATNKVQYIIDYGFDYDGFEENEDLKGLINLLVDYAEKTKDILKGEEK